MRLVLKKVDTGRDLEANLNSSVSKTKKTKLT